MKPTFPSAIIRVRLVFMNPQYSWLIGLLLASVLTNCHHAHDGATTTTQTEVPMTDTTPIGQATMKDDGTVVFMLRAGGTNGVEGNTLFDYRRGRAQ